MTGTKGENDNWIPYLVFADSFPTTYAGDAAALFPLPSLNAHALDRFLRDAPLDLNHNIQEVRHALEAALVACLVRHFSFLTQGHLTEIVHILLTRDAVDFYKGALGIPVPDHDEEGVTLFRYLSLLGDNGVRPLLVFSNTFLFYIVAMELSQQGVHDLTTQLILEYTRSWEAEKDPSAIQMLAVEHLLRTEPIIDQPEDIYLSRWTAEHKEREIYLFERGVVYHPSKCPAPATELPAPCEAGRLQRTQLKYFNQEDIYNCARLWMMIPLPRDKRAILALRHQPLYGALENLGDKLNRYQIDKMLARCFPRDQKYWAATGQSLVENQTLVWFSKFYGTDACHILPRHQQENLKSPANDFEVDAALRWEDPLLRLDYVRFIFASFRALAGIAIDAMKLEETRKARRRNRAGRSATKTPANSGQRLQVQAKSQPLTDTVGKAPKRNKQRPKRVGAQTCAERRRTYALLP